MQPETSLAAYQGQVLQLRISASDGVSAGTTCLAERVTVAQAQPWDDQGDQQVCALCQPGAQGQVSAVLQQRAGHQAGPACWPESQLQRARDALCQAWLLQWQS